MGCTALRRSRWRTTTRTSPGKSRGAESAEVARLREELREARAGVACREADVRSLMVTVDRLRAALFGIIERAGSARRTASRDTDDWDDDMAGIEATADAALSSGTKESDHA